MCNVEKYSFSNSAFTKEATLYLPENSADVKATLLYFHGGGLLYGQREDLPSLHKEMLTKAGFAIISFDYPLAPAIHIDGILEDVVLSINTFLSGAISSTHPELPYFLWGRSAGAYLCLMAAASQKLNIPPAGILSYYGYGFLTDNWFDLPSTYYQQMPLVDPSYMQSLPKEIHTDGPMKTHYSAYVYARQTGHWREMIQPERLATFLVRFSLRSTANLPCPIFCAHSINDTDIPYDEFLALSSKYSARKYVSASSNHDFDRSDSPFMVRQLLNATIKFLQDTLEVSR